MAERLTARTHSGSPDIMFSRFTTPKDLMLAYAELYIRLCAYEDIGLEPEEILKTIEKLECEKTELKATLEMYRGFDGCRLQQLVDADKAGRCVVLPCKMGEAIDVLFSHNEIIALWYDKPNDTQHSFLLWRGEAWNIPEEFKDQRIIKIFGLVPESVMDADTINLRVTPYINHKREADTTIVIENNTEGKCSACGMCFEKETPWCVRTEATSKEYEKNENT